jgi:hypothetical protein
MMNDQSSFSGSRGPPPRGVMYLPCHTINSRSLHTKVTWCCIEKPCPISAEGQYAPRD